MKIRKLLLLFVSIIALQSYAYDFTAKSDDEFNTDLYFTINADGTTVTLTKGENVYSVSSITIPSTVEYNGKTYTVTTIGYYALANAKVGTLVMPNSITEIESYACWRSGLSNVTFSSNLKHIRECAFEEAPITQVVLHEGLETIGRNAFNMGANTKRCMTVLTLPNSLTDIGEGAFAWEASLTEVTIPNKITQLNNAVFEHCGLKSVVLPEGLKSIGDNVFTYCNLEEINFPSTLETIGDKSFQANNFTTIVLPDNIKEIGGNEFNSCGQLKSITFSAGLTELPLYVCTGCSVLTEVNIPSTIKKIGGWAFSGCTLLSHVTIPESVTEIEGYTFYNSGMSSFTFPSSLTSVPSGFFSGCGNLQEIDIPEGITSIDGSAFSGCSNLRRVSLPSTLTTISKNAFSGCVALTDIDIPAAVTEMGGGCFSGCENLSSITIRKGLKTIGDYAFSNCTRLQEITLPKTLETFGQFPFSSVRTIHLNRAIPPKGTGLANYPFLIGSSDNECTLYVPQGSKSAYEALSYYNAKYIEEEDVDGEVIYQVSLNVNNGSGRINVNGEDCSGTSLEVAKGSRVIFTITPKDGYHLSTLAYNDKDVTSKVNGNTYTIESLEEHATLQATCTQNPYILYLKSTEEGAIGIPVERGTSVTCKILAEEGWDINSIYLGNSDVTNQLAEDNTITIKPSYDGATLSVSYEQSTSIQNASVSQSNVQAYVTKDGTLYIKNIESGDNVEVYDSNGKLFKALPNIGDNTSIQLPFEGVYLVVTGKKSIKVIY